MTDSRDHGNAIIGGRRLVYWDWGPVDARPLICVHG